MSGTILLGDVAARTDHLTISCRACPRRGRLRTDKLLIEHGAAMGIPDLLRILAGDCPRLGSTDITKRCDVHAPDLQALFATVGTSSRN
jgi:hypothetical protein